jgi:hypothetical protein
MHVSALEEAQAFVTLRELAKVTAERRHRETGQLCFDDGAVLTGG